VNVLTQLFSCLLICLLFVCIAVVYLPMGEKQVTTIVIGAGSRGSNYANYALDFPQKFKVISHRALGLRMLFTPLVIYFAALALLHRQALPLCKWWD